jgi:hypothetical protein
VTPREDDAEFAAEGTGGSPPADQLAPGWLRQTFVTIATQGRDAGAGASPGQDKLADTPFSLRVSGELPTTAEVSGDDELRARIDAVAGLFGGGR